MIQEGALLPIPFPLPPSVDEVLKNLNNCPNFMKELNSNAIKHVPSGLFCQRGQPGLQGLALEKWAAKTFLR